MSCSINLISLLLSDEEFRLETTKMGVYEEYFFLFEMLDQWIYVHSKLPKYPSSHPSPGQLKVHFLSLWF